MTRELSKSRLMDGQQCPRKLWLRTHRPELAEHSAAREAWLQIDFEVDEQARALYPDGLLIDAPDPSKALGQTCTALREQPDTPLFGAVFERDGVLVRVDLLLPEGEGAYRLVEVKASTGIKPHHTLDVAIQTWVVQDAIRLTGTAVAHLNNRFVYRDDDDYRDLLTFIPMDRAIFPLIDQVPQWIAMTRAVLNSDEPATLPGPQCNDSRGDCPFLAHCSRDRQRIDHLLSTLPRSGDWRKQGERLSMVVIPDPTRGLPGGDSRAARETE